MRKSDVIIFILLCLLLPGAVASGSEQNSKLQILGSKYLQSYPGTVMSHRQAKLAFRVDGPLVKVAIKPGDKVKQGQLLMQIDPRDFEDNIAVLEAQLSGAEAQRKRASRDFERAQTLFEQQVSATADFDRARSAFETAAAGVQSIKAQLNIARHKLRDTSLKAPFSGVVTTQVAENYEMIKAGRVVLEVQDISTLEVEIKDPENEIAQRPLKPGQAATVSFPALSNQKIQAELSEWSSAADPVTRTYALRFSFAAPDDLQVLPGMTAEVSLARADGQPSSYLVPEQQSLSDPIM